MFFVRAFTCDYVFLFVHLFLYVYALSTRAYVYVQTFECGCVRMCVFVWACSFNNYVFVFTRDVYRMIFAKYVLFLFCTCVHMVNLFCLCTLACPSKFWYMCMYICLCIRARYVCALRAILFAADWVSFALL